MDAIIVVILKIVLIAMWLLDVDPLFWLTVCDSIFLVLLTLWETRLRKVAERCVVCNRKVSVLSTGNHLADFD